MLEVTGDSNIYISAFIFAGRPRQFLDAAREGRFQLAISEPLISEINRVLGDKFGWSEAMLDEQMERLNKFVRRVHPTATLDIVQDDPDDNRVIECAVAAGSRYIVTGDNDLLRLGSFNGIQIVKVASFLELPGIY